MSITAPTDITGCKLWLQGNLGLFDATTSGSAVTTDGASVLRWEDQSGTGNHFTEATNPPKRRDSGVGGAQSVRFDGTNDVLSLPHASSSSLATLQTGSYTLVWAIRFNALTAQSTWFAKNGGSLERRFNFLLNNSALTRFGKMQVSAPYSGSTPPAYLGSSAYPANSTTFIIAYTFVLNSTNNGTESWWVGGKLVARKTGAVVAVDTTNPWTLGAYDGGTKASFWNGDMALCCAYNSALSGTDLSDIQEYARAYVSGSAFPTESSAWGIVCDGDSLTNGTGATTSATNYPSQLRALLVSSKGFAGPMVNLGIPGQGVSAMLSTSLTKAVPHAVRTNNILLVWGGTNDISSGATPATVYANLQTYCSQARSSYAKIVVFTMLPRGTITDSLRQTYNQSIRDGLANSTLACDAIVDIGADATIGQAGQTTNTTYYNADQTHLTDAGYTVLANLASPIVGAYLPVSYSRTFSETLSASDTNARTAAFLRTGAESLSYSDTASRNADFLRTYSESVTLADALSRNAAFGRALSESISFADGFQRTGDFARAIFDALTLTDTSALNLTGPSGSDFIRTFSEILPLSDSAAKTLEFLRILAESLGITDSAVPSLLINRSFSDSLTLSDGLIVSRELTRYLSETLGISDALARRLGSAVLSAVVLRGKPLPPLYTPNLTGTPLEN